MGKIKVVIDTNVFISSLLGKNKSNPARIIDEFKTGRFSLVTSPLLLKELEETLKDPDFKDIIGKDRISNLILLIRMWAISVNPRRKVSISSHTEDNKILEAALEAKADFIVSGDKHLLSIESFSIPILPPKWFLEHLNKPFLQ